MTVPTCTDNENLVDKVTNDNKMIADSEASDNSDDDVDDDDNDHDDDEDHYENKM